MSVQNYCEEMKIAMTRANVKEDHDLRASQPSGSQEHLSPIEAENIPAQADLTHSGGRKPKRLAITGAPLPSFQGDQSETESVRLHRVHPKPSQSDSIASESALSRDRVGFVSAKTKSGQSLSRESRHSTLDVSAQNFDFYTLSQFNTLCPFENRPRTTKNPLIKLASLLGTQLLLCLCVPNLSQAESRSLSFGYTNFEPLHAFDPEIERTLHRLRKARHTLTLDSSSPSSIWNSKNNNFTTDESNLFEHQEARSMEKNDRILKELATPNVVYQSWYIQCPSLEPAQSHEFKSNLIHLLPKFHGLAGEDPHKHLKEFHVVCSTMRPQGILEDHIKMKAFPFSLDGAAKDCSLQYLGDIKHMFLEKFFPSSKTATRRRFVGSGNTLARHCMNIGRG
ncbi:hypothetical protein CR513_14007, partial [Mucuna pruriens]